LSYTREVAVPNLAPILARNRLVVPQGKDTDVWAGGVIRPRLVGRCESFR